MKTSHECETIGEYRLDVLGLQQHEVGRRAKCLQGWISQVERGHLPKPWNREALMKAYDLDREEFIRLVENVNRKKQGQPLIQPMLETA